MTLTKDSGANSKAPGSWRLYEHRQDESILILARVVDGSSYECHRWKSEESFVLDNQTFLGIYRRRSNAGP